jgi:membrane-associated protein
MELLQFAIDFVLHLDRHLAEIARDYGTWTYGLLVLIIFCETGLVFTPFLPGDSLLFAAGALAGAGTLNQGLLFGLLTAAAIIGDNSNYWIGRYLGERILHARTARFIKKEHLERTHAFFERYGTKTIIIARFVPIVRTFTPFVAGLGRMTYRRFLPYDIAGGVLWVGSCTFAGFFFGGLQVVKDNFSLVILAIIVISLLPAIVTVIKTRPRTSQAVSVAGEVPRATGDGPSREATESGC